jgi:hypothetical protein
VFPVRYELNFYILFRINSVYKELSQFVSRCSRNCVYFCKCVDLAWDMDAFRDHFLTALGIQVTPDYQRSGFERSHRGRGGELCV